MLTILPSGFYHGYRSCTQALRAHHRAPEGPEKLWDISNRYCDKEDEAQPSLPCSLTPPLMC